MKNEALARALVIKHSTLGIACCGFAAMLAFSGCGAAKQPWEVVHPAKGSVVYKGKPLAGAMVTLVPQDTKFPDSVRPTAVTQDDGSFVLRTYGQADGAPAGEYKAVVMHFPLVISKSNATSGPNDLPKVYASPDSTPLTIQIAADATQIPALELK